MSFHLPESLELHKLQMKLYSGKVWRWEKHFYLHFYHLVICNCLISFFQSDLPASFWGICSCEQKSRKLSFKHRKPQGCYLRCMDGSAKQQPGHKTKSRRVWLLAQPQPCPLPSPSQLIMTRLIQREELPVRENHQDGLHKLHSPLLQRANICNISTRMYSWPARDMAAAVEHHIHAYYLFVCLNNLDGQNQWLKFQ